MCAKHSSSGVIHRLCAAALCLVAFTGPCKATAATRPEPLFLAATADDAARAPANAQTRVGNTGPRWSRLVQLNPAAFQAPLVQLNLDGTEYVVRRTRMQRALSDTRTWSGSFLGDVPGDLSFTRHRGHIAGTLQLGDRRFRLRSHPDGTTRFEELEPPSVPDDMGGVVVPPDAQAPSRDAFSSTPLSLEDDRTVTMPVAVDAAATQTLLVVYTQGACVLAGGCLQVEAEIINKVALTNSVYANSQIGIYLELVGMREVAYAAGDPFAALTALQAIGDGVLDEVHVWRDELNADLVSMIMDIDQTRREFEICGLAYTQPAPLTFYASFAFGVVDFEDTLCSEFTFTHELGHNQGAIHDRVTEETPDADGNVSLVPAGEYRVGYRRCNDGSIDDVGSPFFRTVMAYFCAGATTRAPHFSNPNVLYAGVPTGIDPDVDPDRAAHASRTLNESAASITAYRDGASPPATPSELSAIVDEGPIVQLDWRDNAVNETGFHVYRTAGDADFQTVIATLPPDTTQFTDDTAAPSTTYGYRVAAINAAGVSGLSNATFITTPALPVVEQVPILSTGLRLALLGFIGVVSLWRGAGRAGVRELWAVSRLRSQELRIILGKFSND